MKTLAVFMLLLVSVTSVFGTVLQNGVSVTPVVPTGYTHFSIQVAAGDVVFVSLKATDGSDLDLYLNWNVPAAANSWTLEDKVEPLDARVDVCSAGNLYISVWNDNAISNANVDLKATISKSESFQRCNANIEGDNQQGYYTATPKVIHPSAQTSIFLSTTNELVFNWVTPYTYSQAQTNVEWKFWKDISGFDNPLVTGQTKDTGQLTFTISPTLATSLYYYMSVTAPLGFISQTEVSGEPFSIFNTAGTTFPCSAEKLGVFFSNDVYFPRAHGSSVDFCEETFTAYAAVTSTARTVIYVSTRRKVVVIAF